MKVTKYYCLSRWKWQKFSAGPVLPPCSQYIGVSGLFSPNWRRFRILGAGVFSSKTLFSFFGTWCDDFLASLALVVEVAVDLDLDQCISTKALNTWLHFAFCILTSRALHLALCSPILSWPRIMFSKLVCYDFVTVVISAVKRLSWVTRLTKGALSQEESVLNHK